MVGELPQLDWTFRAMGADWRIHHGGGASGEDAQAVADLVAADERRWSRFIGTSDVARVTRGAGTPVEVEQETIELVEAARAWSQRSNGIFQPLVGAQLAAWGYRGGVGDAAPATAPANRGIPAASMITVSRRDRTVTVPAGTALDLGGIGKSWSAVRAGRLLRDRCADERLIIDAGGDLTIARGTHRVETAAGPVLADEGTGVATSSTEKRQWRLGDATIAHHLLDPRTGAPCARGTAVVAGVDPVAADVLASCVVIEPACVGTLGVPAARIAPDGSIDVGDRWPEVAA